MNAPARHLHAGMLIWRYKNDTPLMGISVRGRTLHGEDQSFLSPWFLHYCPVSPSLYMYLMADL